MLLLLRNAISIALLAVAVVGIAVQVNLSRRGLAAPQDRFVLAGYLLIALYAGASIYVRLRAHRSTRR